MSLAHLDQVIELHYGEPRQLFWQIGDLLNRVAMRSQRPTPVPVDGNLFLALPALQRVAKRLTAWPSATPMPSAHPVRGPGASG